LLWRGRMRTGDNVSAYIALPLALLLCERLQREKIESQPGKLPSRRGFTLKDLRQIRLTALQNDDMDAIIGADLCIILFFGGFRPAEVCRRKPGARTIPLDYSDFVDFNEVASGTKDSLIIPFLAFLIRAQKSPKGLPLITLVREAAAPYDVGNALVRMVSLRHPRVTMVEHLWDVKRLDPKCPVLPDPDNPALKIEQRKARKLMRHAITLTEISHQNKRNLYSGRIGLAEALKISMMDRDATSLYICLYK
jgi:hypothetical protein